MKSNFLILAFLFSASAGASTMSASKGHVEFLAIAKPGSIKIRGKSDSLESKLQWADKKLQGSFSFEVGSLTTGIDLRDTHMKEKHLETAKYPKAELTLKPLAFEKDLCKEAVSSEKLPFTGVMKFHGVEKPVTGEFDIKGDKGIGHSVARFKILLTEYGVEIPKYMGIKVEDQVDTTVEMDWACKD